MRIFLEKTGNRIVDLILRRPWTVFFVGLTIWGGTLAGLPHIRANFTHTAFFRDSDPLLQRFDAFERQFGNDDAIIVVVESPSGVFDLETASLLRELTEKMWHLPEVIRVESLTNFRWVHATGDDINVEPLIPDDVPLTQEILDERREVALNHEVIPDYLVSRDGTIALVYGKIKPGIDAPPNSQAIVLAARRVVDSLRRGDHIFHLTGGTAVNFSFRDSSVQDLKRLIPGVFLLIIIFLLIQLRAVSGVILPIVVVMLSIFVSFAFAGWLGIEFNVVTSILPQALIAIGIADTVHILASFLAGRRSGLPKRDAARLALKKNFIPTVLTSISTAVGFFAYVTANLKPVLGLGLIAGIGTIAAWLISYFIVGPMLVLLPSHVRATRKTEQLESVQPWIGRYVQLLYRFRVAIFVVFAVFCAGSTYLASQVRVNSDPYKYFAKGYPLRDAHDFVLTNLKGVIGFEVVIDSGKPDGIKDPNVLRRVEEFEEKAVKVEGIHKAVSIVDILRQTNRSLNGGDQAFYKLPDSQEAIAQELLLYTMSLPQGMDVNDRMTVNNDALRVSFLSTISDSALWVETANYLEQLGRSLGLNAKVTGKGLLYQSMNQYVVESFVRSLSLAAILISLLLFAFFRSGKIGLMALIPNIIPLILGGAVLSLLGASLDIGTVLVGSVCFGIAVDDTIHVMTHYKRLVLSGLTPHEAIGRVLTHTGPALVVTTIVLMASFGSLAFATFVPNVYFGILSACVLLTALVTDLVVLPALLMTFPTVRTGSAAAE